MAKDIATFVEKLPRTAAYFRIRVGDSKTQETVGFVALSNIAGAVENATGKADDEGHLVEVCKKSELTEVLTELAETNGWPDEHPTLRIHSYSKDHRAGRTHQKTKKGPALASRGAVTVEQSLSDTIVRMAHANTATLNVQNEIIHDLGQQVIALSNEVLDLRRQLADSEADSVDAQLELILENVKAGAEDDAALREQVQGVITRLGNWLMGGDEEEIVEEAPTDG